VNKPTFSNLVTLIRKNPFLTIITKKKIKKTDLRQMIVDFLCSNVDMLDSEFLELL